MTETVSSNPHFSCCATAKSFYRHRVKDVNQMAQILFFVLLGLIGASFLTGIPLWIVGVETPSYYQCDEIVSVPLIPATTDEMLYWIGDVPDDMTTDNNSLKIPMPLSSFPSGGTGTEVALHVVHNLYGYNITAELTDERIQVVGREERNAVIGEGKDPEKTFTSEMLPAELYQYGGKFRVKCPYSTRVTAEAKIEPQCRNENGAYMALDGLYEDIELMFFVPKDFDTSKTTVVLRDLIVVPTNFIETPQMFLGVWKKSNRTLLMDSGISLTVAGLAMLLIFTVVFLLFWNSW